MPNFLKRNWNNLVTKAYIGKLNSASDNLKEIKNLSNVYNFDINSNIVFNNCVSILATTKGKIAVKFVYYKDDSKEELYELPLYDLLLYQPNNYQNAFDFWSTIEAQRSSTGNSYVKINRDKKANPISFDIIDKEFIKCDVVNGSMYYKFDELGIINYEDILHFKRFSFDGKNGQNPQEAIQNNINLMGSCSRLMNKYYENKHFHLLFLKSTLSNSNPQAIKKFLEDIEKENGSVKFELLPTNTELQSFQLNFAETQILESMKYNTQQLAAYFGIPPSMVGEYSASKFSTLEQQQLDFKVNTIQPIIRAYEAELNIKLLSKEDRLKGYYIEHDLNSLVEVDLNSRLNKYEKLFGKGVLSPNDIAIAEGYKGFEGGDKHYIMTNNLSPIDDIKDNLNVKNDNNMNGK